MLVVSELSFLSRLGTVGKYNCSSFGAAAVEVTD
jgi:hypothetical protein